MYILFLKSCWGITELQSCLFRCTAKWFRCARTCVHSFQILFDKGYCRDWVALLVLHSWSSSITLYMVARACYSQAPNLSLPYRSSLVTVSLFLKSVSLLFVFLSWTDLVWDSLGPSLLLQMALFHSFFFMAEKYCKIPHFLYPFRCHWTLRLATVDSAAVRLGCVYLFWTSSFCIGAWPVS